MYKKNIFSIGTVCVLFALSPAILANPKTNPNVIYIYASDLGKGLLSTYGQRHFSTPNIDALFKEGVSFNHAYGGSVTAYSRASLLTGYDDCSRNKWRIVKGGGYMQEDTIYVLTNEAIVDDNVIFLPENDLYLPQVFQKAGYLTGQIGMLGIGNMSTRQQMKRYGWDYCYGFLDLVRSKDYYPQFLFENDQTVLTEKSYAPELFINKIVEFIHECKDSPFFLMYSSPLPHGPVSIPAVHPEVADNDALTQVEKEYASMVKLLDGQIGIIRKELQALNLEENTIIVFSSDNGYDIHYFQEEQNIRPFINKKTGEKFDNIFNKYYSSAAGDVFNGNAGLAGLKYSNLEGGIRVPLAFYWKGKLNNSICEEFVSGYDFLPTMADLLGIKLQTPKDGVSYLPTLLKGKKISKKRHLIIGSSEGPAIITNEGWKLRYYNKQKIYELYNLKKDPEEKYNVILRFPDIAEKVKKTLLDACNGVIENGILY